MRNTALILFALIAVLTLVKSNIGILPDQIIWVTSPDLFYKVFVPLVMLVSSIVAITRKENLNYFFLAFGVVFIDAIYFPYE
jgi:hypothetical protein